MTDTQTEIEALRSHYERKFGAKATREAEREIFAKRTDEDRASAWRQLIHLS